jgi:predicted alpha/beta-hydrolase family hydrolase
MTLDSIPQTIAIPDGTVSGLLLLPADAVALLVFGHGAGAGMRHRFLEDMSRRLAGRRIGTLRYQFPYMERRQSRTDPPAVAAATVRAAYDHVRAVAPGLPLFAGGKSFGGRMTSTAQAGAPLPDVRGLVFFGFPLHPPRKPATMRAEHLARVTVPMLFLQGTRDDLAELELIRGVTSGLPTATLHVVEAADHSFAVLKKSGRTGEEVMSELESTTAEFVGGLV